MFMQELQIDSDGFIKLDGYWYRAVDLSRSRAVVTRTFQYYIFRAIITTFL